MKSYFWHCLECGIHDIPCESLEEAVDKADKHDAEIHVKNEKITPTSGFGYYLKEN